MRISLILVTAFAVLLVSCGEGSDATAPSEDADAFVGSGSCVMTPTSNEITADATREIREHFSCTLESSDERVTGSRELDTVTVARDANAPMPDALMWWSEQDVITTEGGTWRVSEGYGVVDMVGVHPLAERVWPFNYEVSRYVGEDGYSGLELTIIYTGTNESGGLSGWIEES